MHIHRMHKKSAGLEDAFRLYLASRTLPAIHAILTVWHTLSLILYCNAMQYNTIYYILSFRVCT